MRVGRDGYAGLSMRLGYCSQNALHSLGHAGRIGCALENSSLDAGVRDALLNVLQEHLYHRLGSFERCAGSAKMEVERDVVVGVNSGRDDDVDGCLPSHSLDAWNVAAKTDHGEVDHGF